MIFPPFYNETMYTQNSVSYGYPSLIKIVLGYFKISRNWPRSFRMESHIVKILNSWKTTPNMGFLQGYETSEN